WTLRGFVAGIPADLEEAAMIDGCSRTGAFWRVTFPLLAPGLVATGVFAFIQAWNEFVFALVIMTRPESQTLPIWLRSFVQATKATD
ncbi:ABC transporter permease subunit, partial [Salmonella enterica subsp. enterica serovar Poona]|nr:ABC transporter permease subunit [Salmonella enterica subsp. enterica serovar Poona]